jgi:predicted DNA-binding transcriptional regulator YafY
LNISLASLWAEPDSTSGRLKYMQRQIDTIEKAIRKRQYLNFTYEGHERRDVEPYILGVVGNGHLLLSGYQNRGSGLSGEVPSWKSFLVENIDDLKISDKSFRRNRPEYNPRDPHFRKRLAQI